MAQTKIKFTGRDDLRVLGADDLKKAGVEGFTKTSFSKGVIVEVEANVAKALIDHPELFGSFETIEQQEAASTEGTDKKTVNK